MTIVVVAWFGWWPAGGIETRDAHLAPLSTGYEFEVSPFFP